MKRLAYVFVVILISLMFLPAWSAYAQPPGKKSFANVPITYPGDNDETINRRAKWIEQAKQEKEMVLWTSLKPQEINRIADAFNKIYPYIKLTYWSGKDVSRDAKLEQEHSIGKVTVDFCDAGEITSFPRWRKMGLVAKYTDIIPGGEKRDERMFSKYGDWAQLGNNAIVPMYNTNLVSAAEAPKSWEDLLDPKWKGKIGITTDMKAWYTLALAEGGWGIEKTEVFLRKLQKQNLIWAPGQSPAHTLLMAGEYHIMCWNYLRYMWARDRWKEGAPVDWVRVSPVPATGPVRILPQKAPHPNAVRLFIEWIFSPQGQALYEQLTGYGNAAPGSGTHLSKVLEGLTVVYRTEDVLLEADRLGLIENFSKILGIAN